MTRNHPENERVKRRYLDYLRAAKGMSEESLDAVVKALHRYEEVTRYRDFAKFHIEQAIAFRKQIGEAVNTTTGKALARATVLSTLNALRAFFLWLADQPGYRNRIRYADAEYFRLSEKETRVARASRPKPVPTLEQLTHILASMPADSDIQRRDRAVVAVVMLTGVRDGALVSLKLKHLDLDGARLVQDAREVDTKFSKSFTTWFYPVGDAPLHVVADYDRHLRVERLWGNDDALFPATEIALNEMGEFAASGLTRRHWQDAGPVRDIFKAACALAGLPYFHPHSVRRTLVQLGFRVCKSLEELKAWSQNMGHSDMMTTLTSYGEIPEWRQGELIRKLRDAKAEPAEDDLVREAVEFLRKVKGGQGS